MAATPDFTDFGQFLSDEVDIADWCAALSIPYSILPGGSPPSVAPASPNVRPQLPDTFFPETAVGMSFAQVPYDVPQGTAQDPYLPLLGAPESTTILSRTAIASFDDSIHAAQWNEINGLGLSDVSLMQLSTVLPAIPQSLPSPSLASISVPNWIEVPQKVYGHGNRQWDFVPSEPTFFNVNGFPGINMGDALRKVFTGLDGRDDAVLQNATQTVSCRLLFPGYPPNVSYQVSTLGWTKNRTRITRSKLAYEIAKKLNQYLESMTGYPMDGSTDQRWKIGEGFMHLENMFLVRLVSVSKGSFQPVISVVDSLM